MERRLRRKNFGEWLKATRESAGLTQAELAALLSYENPQIISNIERGVSALPTRRIADFAKALRCEAVELEFRWLASSVRNEETARACALALKYLPAMRIFAERLVDNKAVENLAQTIQATGNPSDKIG
jgi:transcriptional regulator with XRE-family HTH domain